MSEPAEAPKKFRVHFSRMEFSVLELESGADVGGVIRAAVARSQEAAIDFTTEKAPYRVEAYRLRDPSDPAKGGAWVAIEKKFAR